MTICSTRRARPCAWGDLRPTNAPVDLRWPTACRCAPLRQGARNPRFPPLPLVDALFGRTRLPVLPLLPGVIETAGPELPSRASGLGGHELGTSEHGGAARPSDHPEAVGAAGRNSLQAIRQLFRCRLL